MGHHEPIHPTSRRGSYLNPGNCPGGNIVAECEVRRAAVRVLQDVAYAIKPVAGNARVVTPLKLNRVTVRARTGHIAFRLDDVEIVPRPYCKRRRVGSTPSYLGPCRHLRLDLCHCQGLAVRHPILLLLRRHRCPGLPYPGRPTRAHSQSFVSQFL